MPEKTEVSPRRVAGVLSVLFALQLLAMLILVAGAVVLMTTFAHNNAVDCPTDPGFGPIGCAHRSYALAVGLLIGGGGLFVSGMAASAYYGMRHVGAPLLGALTARRRLLEQDADH